MRVWAVLGDGGRDGGDVALEFRVVAEQALRLPGLADGGNQLRDTLAAARQRLPADPATTGSQAAATGLDLLGECSAAVEQLAAAADAHASDVKTLTDAWPK